MPGSVGEHRLQDHYGTAARARAFYDHQMLDHLNDHMQEFIRRMEMVFIATADGSGEADCSFRAGPPGFVYVLTERALLYPEYRGNGVMGSLGNLTENPHLGLLFIDFCGDGIGLHVNGDARILENEELIRRPGLPVPDPGHLPQTGGRRPERWVRIDVTEAYIHCARHIPRMIARSEHQRAWGTDEPARTRGDYFKAKTSPRPWVPARVAG
jgi:uncharacterized protein